MILYHFTRPECVEGIMRDGLVASNADFHNSKAAGGEAVVWLTTRDDNSLSLEERRRMLYEGILCGPKTRHLPAATVCLRVVIPSTDRKLKQYLPWARKRGYSVESGSQLVPLWWIYLGNIAPKHITIFKHVPRGQSYWELPCHKEWLAGAELVFDPEHEANLLAGRAGPDVYMAEHTDETHPREQ